MKRAILTITAEALSQSLGMRPWIKVERIYQAEDDIANDTFTILVAGEGLPGDCDKVEFNPPLRVELSDLQETD